MQLRRIPVSKINPAPYNPRKDLAPGDPEYERLKRSLDEFGCVEPLVWNRTTGNLVGGHQRFKILLARGDTVVIASVVELPLEREKALNIALNKVQGEWDLQKLAELLDELVKLPEFDVGITGFDPPEVDELLAGMLGDQAAGEETFDVEAAMAEAAKAGPAVTKPGDLIVLGSPQNPRRQHRLLCGDSTDPAQVRLVMNGERAALFATDPPYLVNYNGMNHPGSKRTAKPSRTGKDKNKDWSESYGITWDDADANPELYEKFIAVAVAEAIRGDAAWYCWHASRRQAMVEAVWEKHGAFVHQQIIWAKDRPILTRSHYLWQHEPCFYGWVRTRPGGKPYRNKEAPFLSSVWSIPTIPVGQKTDHPTSKPTLVFEIPMLQHTRAGEVCYEPFCGSGSQIIAAEKTGRRCAAIEISPRYCDVIVRRFIAFAGEKSVPG